MFEYLSFLRPPPACAGVHSQITLVPQIANDLRTELCETEYEVYYTWQHADGHLHHGNYAKLTTWRLGGTYKPISIPLPSEARPGDRWRLCLVALSPGHRPSLTLDLSQPSFGQVPFPVTSMLIDTIAADAVSSSTGPKTKKSRQTKTTVSKVPAASTDTRQAKQERIERYYLLRLSSILEQDIIIRITEQTSFDLDKKIWDSGVALSAWLAQLLGIPSPAETSAPKPTPNLVTVLRNRLRFEPCRRALQIVELGAGTGLVSLLLGALLARSPHESVSPTAGVRRARILATDLPSAIELIEHNRAANEHLFRGLSAEGPQGIEQGESLIDLRGVNLDWDQPIPTDIWETDAETGTACPFDIIIMADVTYNTASFSALLDTVTGLLKGPNPSRSPMILLAYKCRDVAERTLWEDASARGISFVQVDSIRGVREPEVEIWIGGWAADVKALWGNNV